MSISGGRQQNILRLRGIYREKKKEIIGRLGEFDDCLTKKDDADVFKELAFCLLTPQSKAQCCWDAIQTISSLNLLLAGTENDLKKHLQRVRFHNKKARYLAGAREIFRNAGCLSVKNVLAQFSDAHECREWLVKNVRGLGYKEASHFLRNIGFGGNQIAILDRHILKNLLLFGVIREIPKSLSKSKYLDVERKMAGFSRSLRIPLAHLDLLFWYKETGEIFK